MLEIQVFLLGGPHLKCWWELSKERQSAGKQVSSAQPEVLFILWLIHASAVWFALARVSEARGIDFQC